MALQFELIGTPHYNAPPKESEDGLNLLQEVVITTGIVGNPYTTDYKFVANDIVVFSVPLNLTGDAIQANIMAQAVDYVATNYPPVS